HFAGVIGVEEYGAHGRRGFAVLPERCAGFGSDLFERAVFFVVEQEVLGLVVGDVDIGVPVAIEVARGNSHRAALERRNAGLFADIDVAALAGVVKQQIGIAFVIERPG